MIQTLEDFSWAIFIAAITAYLVWCLIETLDNIREEINNTEDDEDK